MQARGAPLVPHRPQRPSHRAGHPCVQQGDITLCPTWVGGQTQHTHGSLWRARGGQVAWRSASLRPPAAPWLSSLANTALSGPPHPLRPGTLHLCRRVYCCYTNGCMCCSLGPRHAAPWLTKLANAALSGRLTTPGPTRVQLAREAVDNLEKLGPTYCKLGQIMSIRWVGCKWQQVRDVEGRLSITSLAQLCGGQP